MPPIGKIDLGFPTKLFDRATAGSGDQFSLPPLSERYMGKLILAARPQGGTLTALVVNLEVSFDGAATWVILVTGINLMTGTTTVSADVSGAGNGLLCRLTSTTFTLGTATSVQIWGHAG